MTHQTANAQSANNTTAKSHNTNNLGSVKGSLWQIVAALCFTVMGILVKIASDDFGMHAAELVFWRVLFGVVFLGIQALLLQQSFATAYPKAHFWRSLAGATSLLMFFYGISHLPLATAITFSYTSSVFLAVFSVILLKQRPSVLTWFALLLGLFGIVLLLQPTLVEVDVLPTFIGLGSGMLAGYAYLQVRELSLLGEPSWRIVFYFSVLSAVGSAIVSSVIGWSVIDWAVMPYLLGIGITAVAGQLAMTYAYKVGHKFLVAAMSYLVVVLSALYGVIAFGESLSVMAVLGIICIIISGVVAGIKK